MAPTAMRRRAKLGALTLLLLAAVTASVVAVNVLGHRFAARVDVTATGEHRLSPRTLRLLERLAADPEPGGYEIVIAGDHRALDRRALERVRDVLDGLTRASERVSCTFIDTASASGLAEFDALLERLAERESATLEAHRAACAAAADGLEALAGELDTIAGELVRIHKALPAEVSAANKAYFEQAAGAVLQRARLGREAAAAGRAALGASLGSTRLVDTDGASDALRKPLEDLERELGVLAGDLRTAAAATVFGAEAQDLAGRLETAVRARRDRAALLKESLERLRRSDLVKIAKVLETTDAALVIGPPARGLRAIAFERLFPPAGVLDAATGATADLGRNAEELFTSALGSLADPARPIVVLVHGENARFRDVTARHAFEGLFERLELRGLDVLEWAAALDAEPPSSAKIDPRGERPMVYVVLGTDSTTGSASGGGLAGPDRARRIGAALATLVQRGEPILLSVSPSLLPTYGDPDPTVAVLPAFGLEADTARPLFTDRFTAAGRVVETELTVRSQEVDHPLAAAMRGLPTLLRWPVPLRTLDDAPAGVTVTTLCVAEGNEVWAESQWLGLWQVRHLPAEQRGLMPDLPTKDAGRDDVEGPWTLAAAAERSRADLDRPQRLVAIGSNTWFTDDVTNAKMQFVDGRLAPAYPGNAELFEAAVLWLAGQDDLIARSAAARAVPLIAPVSEGRLTALRWLVMAGLPALVLVLGAIWRVVRG